MCSELNDIQSNTEKYAGFYLEGIGGNLYMNGDVSAEQNFWSGCVPGHGGSA
jgi:hypothetical protein